MKPIVIRKKETESIEHLLRLEGTYKIHVGNNRVIIESMDKNEMVFVCETGIEVW